MTRPFRDSPLELLVFAALWPAAGWFLGEQDRTDAINRFVVSTCLLAFGLAIVWAALACRPSILAGGFELPFPPALAVLLPLLPGVPVCVIITAVHVAMGGSGHPDLYGRGALIMLLGWFVAVGFGVIVALIFVAPLWLVVRALLPASAPGAPTGLDTRLGVVLSALVMPSTFLFLGSLVVGPSGVWRLVPWIAGCALAATLSTFVLWACAVRAGLVRRPGR